MRSHRPTGNSKAIGFTVVVALFAVAVRAETPNAARKPMPVVLAHYMPWYEAKPFSSRWGWHWTMNVFHPDMLVNGQPQLASHYHPLIGPYDSGDPHVLEYHALTMKLGGIDGVVVDWYGREEYLDYARLHRHTTALIAAIGKANLRFVICYEDQTIPKLVAAGRLASSERVAHARRELDWLAAHWFRDPAYVRVNGQPLLLSFGYGGLTDAEWMQLLEGRSDSLVYLSEHHRRPGADGAFDWPLPKRGLESQRIFLQQAADWPVAMPVAFPRFHDIYQEAKIHESWGRIDDNDGRTFTQTLEQALRSGLPLVQIATWNDWGEGTMIEPSVEFGYRDLMAVQQLRRQQNPAHPTVAEDDLRLPLRLYRLRKSPGGATRASLLDTIARHLADRDLPRARDTLARAETESHD